ncbi:Triosephosphate isomerase [Arsenophonus endosymbiont of Bemisia tabaci Q2]|nr:Triosephosphate isomerase [Arsenophonus endosymbiont of Bemisia tabaci Q2]
MRHPLVMGNWKLNGSTKMVEELIENLRNELNNVTQAVVSQLPHQRFTWRKQNKL